jgi:outer membrane lipoprotein-sorting protein
MNFRNDNRGIAHVAAIGLIAMVVAVVGFAGWRVMEKNKDSKSTANSSGVSSEEMKEVEKECNKELDDKDLCKFASNVNFEQAYKATITSTSADGTTVMEMESDGKGNSSMTTRENGKESGAFITLNNTSYFRDFNSGTWFKLAGSESDTNSDVTEDVKIKPDDFKNDKATFKKIGKEKCGNLNCFKYQITEKDSPNVEQFVWFDDKEFQLRKWTTREGAKTSEMVMTYGSVNIKAPSPVKDYPTQSNSDMEAAIQAAQEAMTASEQ